MKRSEVNKIIEDAMTLTQEMKTPLPPFAYWSVEDWKKIGPEYKEIIDNMLGWDVTDFGSGDFEKIGLTVFTFRSGNFNKKNIDTKPYAEKLLIVKDGQVLPFHFHWRKMEDIINRGGGDLKITLYNAAADDSFADTKVEVTIDGRQTRVEAGGTVVLKPGESITLLPRQYHSWQGVKGTGDVVLFEVSTTNDDFVDNRFYHEMIRLPEYVENTEPNYLTFMDYKKYTNI